MSSPFNSVEDVRRYVAELDSQHCPVAIRARELRAERERQTREARETREQQRQAANISQEWWTAIDQRIHGYMLHIRLACAEALAAAVDRSVHREGRQSEGLPTMNLWICENQKRIFVKAITASDFHEA
jgi:hypothetical protein